MNQILYKGEVFGGVGEDVTNKKYEEIIIHNPITDMDETFKPIGGQNAEIFNSYKDITDTSTERNIAACAFSQVNGESNKDLTRGAVGAYNNISGNLNISIDTTFLQENGNSNFVDNSRFAIVNGYNNHINKAQFSIISGSDNNINKTNISTLIESLIDLDEELSPVTIREYGSGIKDYFIDSNNQIWYLDEVFSKENHTFANGCYSKSQDFIVIDRNFKNYTIYKILIEEWQQGINYGGLANYIIGFNNEAFLQSSDNCNFIFGNKNTLVTNSEHNFISGYNNNIHATRTTVFGQEHLIQNGYDLFVSGAYHEIDDSVGSAVFGSNNKIKKEESYGSPNYNFISGANNTLTNSYQALICGSEHIVKNSQAPTIFGQRNEVSEVLSSGLVSGYGNKVKKIEKGCAIFGTGNDVGQTFNGSATDGTIVYGDMNKIGSSRASIIGGLGNQVDNSIGSLIFGSSTTSNVSYNSLIFSLHTEANDITNSLVGGSDSKITRVNDSIVLGTRLSGETIDDVVQPTAPIGQSLVIGYGHIIKDAIASTNILGTNHNMSCLKSYLFEYFA